MCSKRTFSNADTKLECTTDIGKRHVSHAMQLPSLSERDVIKEISPEGWSDHSSSFITQTRHSIAYMHISNTTRGIIVATKINPAVSQHALCCWLLTSCRQNMLGAKNGGIPSSLERVSQRYSQFLDVNAQCHLRTQNMEQDKGEI